MWTTSQPLFAFSRSSAETGMCERDRVRLIEHARHTDRRPGRLANDIHSFFLGILPFPKVLGNHENSRGAARLQLRVLGHGAELEPKKSRGEK